VPESTPTPRLSTKISAIAESATLKVDAKAKALQAQGRPVISYAAGEPDFPTPEHIVEAAAAAVRDPKNHRYTPAAGLPELREAIAEKTLRDSGLEVSPSQVIVTNGGKQAVYEAFATLLDPGDEVLVPDPGYTTFTMNAHLVSAVPVPYPLRPENGFAPDLAELEPPRMPIDAITVGDALAAQSRVRAHITGYYTAAGLTRTTDTAHTTHTTHTTDTAHTTHTTHTTD
jgi:aspartate aminotransferase